MGGNEFNSEEPIAYFITWTSYGTWLLGDERGWWHKGDGERYPPNELFREMAESEMKEQAFTLSHNDREIVEATVIRHCQVRSWTLHIVRARSNHVHLVVTAPGYDPETVRDQMKAWCTRHLKQEHADRERFWTEGASCRSINNEDDLEAAIAYVGEAQDRKDRDANA